MKKTKIILVAALGICMLSFMPAVVGKADVRPISAFTATNVNVAAWGDHEGELILMPHGRSWVSPVETIADCDPGGSLLVRELKDGRILYKVNLHVKGAFMEMFWNLKIPGIPWYLFPPIFVGEMDYYFSAIIIVEEEIGDPVPTFRDVWFGVIPGKSPFSQITGSGTGEFTEYGGSLGLGFITGATAKVKLNQVGMNKPEGHPFYPGMWPAELVFFH